VPKDLSEIKPSTLEGIKRLATHLKKAQSIQHAVALDKAAKQAGYENYRHAFKELSK
jgi:hypothetical protein